MTEITSKEFKKIALAKGIIVSFIKDGCKDATKIIDKDIYWMITNEEVDRIVVEIRLIPTENTLVR